MVAVINGDTFIVLNLDDLRQFTPEIIAKVKSILCNKGYTLITQMEIPVALKLVGHRLFL